MSGSGGNVGAAQQAGDSNPDMNRTTSAENNAKEDPTAGKVRIVCRYKITGLFSSAFFSQNAHFMKKIPKGAEASNILVGELNILDKPLSAFIRLSEATILGDLTEVPVPTRFIFILLGPAVMESKSSLIFVFTCIIFRARTKSTLHATMRSAGRWPPSWATRSSTTWRTRPENASICWLVSTNSWTP